MTHGDWLALLYAAACALFAFDALAGAPAGRFSRVPAGLALVALAFLLKATGTL